MGESGVMIDILHCGAYSRAKIAWSCLYINLNLISRCPASITHLLYIPFKPQTLMNATGAIIFKIGTFTVQVTI